MDTITLYEEYRLVERSESEVNGVWKGAHLLLFFLAFVFGSFCTFCFHMLMYLFDEKCVLFPKLLSLTSLKQNIIYEFIPEDKEIADMLPVDFLSTQWVDKSICYLPTYVPLVSGIFGLVWTTMFLMCSTGSRPLTGLQRPWRVLLPVFVFSLAMGGLCLYSTIVTHSGLQELCVKLGEITGSSTCTYSVNVATLAYERRIRGVYQATRITILSAWLHTLCWLLSALLTLARVILIVDFQLVKISVELRGNIDKMLEHHEMQLRTVSPDIWTNTETSPGSRASSRSQSSVKVHFQKKEQTSRLVDTSSLESMELLDVEERTLYTSPFVPTSSVPSLVDDERIKLDRMKLLSSIAKDKQFIVKILFDLIDSIDTAKEPKEHYIGPSLEGPSGLTRPLTRQYGREAISTEIDGEFSETVMGTEVVEQIVLEIIRESQRKTDEKIIEPQPGPSTSKWAKIFESLIRGTEVEETLMGVSSEKLSLKSDPGTSNVQGQDASVEKPVRKKSNLKTKNIQTDETKKTSSPKVKITESKTSVYKIDDNEPKTEVDPKEEKNKEPEEKKKD